MHLRRALLTCLLLVALIPPHARAASPLRLGFGDGDAFTSASPTDNATNLIHAKRAGASLIRFSLSWAGVSPTRPPTSRDAADPAWSGYSWAATDTTIRTIVAAGLSPLAILDGAPRWAEGPDRPRDRGDRPVGPWKPDAAALRSFATALAKRYSGRFADPATPGTPLPAVDHWQAWNEPNLDNFLTPQWRKTASGYLPASPDIYRRLLNGFYAGVKSVSRSNVVLTAGTAPFGDLHPGERRMPPAKFWRELLCVKGRAHPRAARCGKPVRFDILAHHPYPIGPPRRHARNVDDVVVPDLAKITKPLALAIKAGTVQPAKPKPIWITEISWDSKPDPDGLSQADQAQYLAGSLNTLWRQGADAVLWYVMRDQAPEPSWDTTFQSGVFERGATPAEDTPKPSFTAFRFPFTAYRSEGVARLWGMAPAAGPVMIQVQKGSTWVDAISLRAGRERIFQGRLRVGRGTRLRAVSRTAVSLPWTTF